MRWAAVQTIALALLTPLASASRCSSVHLACGLPHNAQIISTTLVPQNGTYNESPPNLGFPQSPTSLPELCAVIIRVESSPITHYSFGLFLPTEWNERMLTVGGGGFAGGINWLDMGSGVRYGFASMSPNLGHNSQAINLTWAENPESREDFCYRSTEGSVNIAKKVIKKYYRGEARYSYYSGCSMGGRQGLKEVQMNPDSFDGILVGAPAWWLSHLTTFTVKVGLDDAPSGEGYVPPGMFALLSAEVRRQCDPQDGVEDGIVSDPPNCDFDFTPLKCVNTTENCFTPSQIETIQDLYADYIANGDFAFPGYSLSSESQWPITIGGPEPSPLGIDWVRYFLLDDPTFPASAYNDSIVEIGERADPGNCDAVEYDMAPFHERGGKIIMYHGWADGLIPTESSSLLYTRLASAMGGVDSLRKWFRYFLVPGMGHCAGSDVNAPWYFAGANQAGTLKGNQLSTPGFVDSRHDALLALVEWVESGEEPEEIVATTWNVEGEPGSGVLRQRPLCPFPQEAVYDREGDVDDEKSWQCK